MFSYYSQLLIRLLLYDSFLEPVEWTRDLFFISNTTFVTCDDHSNLLCLGADQFHHWLSKIDLYSDPFNG